MNKNKKIVRYLVSSLQMSGVSDLSVTHYIKYLTL